MARAAKTTTDHDEIRRWVEARGGHPAHVAQSAEGGDPGILRIDYPGFSGEGTLEPIEWDEFFDWFDRNNLAFLYQDSAKSRFSKFVARESSGSSSKRSSSKKKTTTKKAATKKGSSSKKSSASKKASSTKKSSTTKKASSTKASSSKKSASTKKASSSSKKVSTKKASKSSSKKRR